MTSIWWIRRDVRLHDQPALSAAIAQGPVVPVFVLDPALLARTPTRRQGFLFLSLRALDAELRALGARLIVRTGSPVDILREIATEAKASVVFAEEDFTPYARARDAAVREMLDLRLVQGQCLHPPQSLLKSDGTPYVVYTPYARAWKRSMPSALTPVPTPAHIAMPEGIRSEALPDADGDALFPAGEMEAQRCLNRFLQEGVFRYSARRDRMDLDGTSSLSPYLRFGALSMRAAVAAVLEAQEAAPDEASRNGAETWLGELIWREFYIQILYHFPHVSRGPFRRDFARILWRDEQADFENWQNGTTGVPIVDAGMRQLRETGWMHNRARMITASYLVKDLLINWRRGESWFMDNLIDGDPPANNGGWQWTAGTGTDAAPYFRIFNPVLQGKKFDPEGNYVRRWVPELANVPSSSIHAPWEKGLEVPGYPRHPIVNHAEAVRRTRLAYESARDQAKTEGIS
jgi:deoxyribodipyrimidine photo-lyase